MAQPTNIPSRVTSLEWQQQALSRQRESLLDELKQYQATRSRLMAVFDGHYRRQATRDATQLRRSIQRINNTLVDLREQQMALLFLECLEEELAKCSPAQLGIT